MRAWGSLIARLRRMDPFRADALLAAVFAAWVAVEAFVLIDATPDQRLFVCGLALVQAVGLALRRRAPLLGPMLVVAAFAVLNTLPRDVSEVILAPFLVVLLATYSLGANAEERRLAAGVAFTVVACAFSIYADDYPNTAGDFVFAGLIVLAGPVLLGRVIRHRGRLNRALREKAAQLEAERATRSAEAVLEERTRIAGELHDVVAHALSAMVVQASGARRLVERDPERARAALQSVEGTGREALTEIRRLLGVLRREDEDIALAPQPSLEHLSTLVRRAEAAGLPVALRVEGEARPLPAGVDLTAYRVVQEALNSALDPGAAGRAEVMVRYRADTLELEVLDDGAGEPAGRRLLGTSERVRLYGGELQAGRRREGGHRLRARLPLEGTA